MEEACNNDDKPLHKRHKKAKSNEQHNLPVYNNGLIVATRELKKSGQAIVYQGKFSTTGNKKNKAPQDVAIKVYFCRKQGWDECQVECYMFLQLRQAHVNVMRILDCFETPQPALVTPYIAGGDLCDYLQANGPFSSTKQVNEILRGIGEGLAHLHKHNLVHRDLKSPNIVLQPVVMDIDNDDDDDKPWFRPVIIDLGHAAILPCKQEDDDDSDDDNDGQLVTDSTTCTYAWRPPEMILHYQYSFKTDMYALGIIMWEILTGDFPYRGCDEDWIMGFVAHDKGRPDQICLEEDNNDDTEESDTDEDRGFAVFIPEYESLHEQLWHQEPNERPSATEFLAGLATITRLTRLEEKKKRKVHTLKRIARTAAGEIIDLCSLQRSFG